MKLCPRCAEPYADDAGFCPFDGTALARNPDPFVGRTLAARYRLVRPVGSGGMAVVYLARHVMIERMSAIKILRQDLGMNVSHRERFLREARAVNRINHPNIVEITDFGEDGGLVFLVMEYVEGESLQAALVRGRFELPRAVRIALQISSALGRAHELGVIHRDLKPENVLILQRGGSDFAKLTDFGIAKIVDAPALTFSEQRFGTPGYISPEYIDGEPATALGDIYALGVVLYQLVTGKLPFDAKVPVALLALALQGKPVKPSARVEGIPPELEDLILKMIARKPEDRPRDAYAVFDALEGIMGRLSGNKAAQPKPVSPPIIDLSATVVDPGPYSAALSSSSISPQSWLAAELTERPFGEIDERWIKTLDEFERHIHAAVRKRGEDGGVRRARDLAETARGLLTSLDRAKANAAAHQATVDGLEVRGRAFRASLGHAIDALSRDRSRELAHLEAIAALRGGIHEEMEAIRAEDARQSETLAWEAAAVQAEETRAMAVDADLSFQIDTLQKQLEVQNGELEAELAEATGMLEGGLAAVRRITGELVRTMADAANSL
ncbi:MAG TPA: serine/threonine-protein kinase [Polyangiaceae bacterium]|jgi:serine/threonine-protein kinase|nr:serine/threonine-protein kinase [Polyangiaceae bacterium]